MTQKTNILIVDDRPESLLSLATILDDLDCHVVTARSGREALRRVLERDFAVILLDVNMPGMDGFETAELIRLRPSSRRTPIIFVTAYSDEMHMARGYSLGAVDYILAPVVPEVLKTKVGVFIDLFEKTQQVARQADSLRRYTSQLHELTEASLAIHSAGSMDELMRIVAETARQIVGAECGAVGLAVDGDWSRARWTVSRAGQEPAPALPGPHADGEAICSGVLGDDISLRLVRRQISGHPGWPAPHHDGDGAPPATPPRNWLGARLTGRGVGTVGLVEATEKMRGDFTPDDEAVFVQFAQITAIAVENILSADAREANRLKDEFLATLSHELRTPLNAMLGWTRLLRTQQPSPEELAHGLEVVERNVTAQSKLIEDLLDVSRITSGKFQLEPSPMPLTAALEAALDAARPAAEAKSIRFEPRIEPTADRVLGDADRIQQVFWNLLSNAIKFTPRGGRIGVRLERQGAHLCVRVTDTGQGIEPDLLPHVFERFRQADSTSTRAHGGLGVGLAIVRHIVEQHGGSVHAQSDGPGAGSVFTVRLPVAKPAGAGGEADAPGAAPQATAPADGDALAGVRVLVVDDDDDAREMVGQMLRRHEADVAEAASADEALAALRRDEPAIIVSDIAMPGEDGYGLIRRVRAEPADLGRRIPAVALTAYAADADRARALAAGFDAHLPKPIEPAQLIRVLTDLLARTAEPPAEPTPDASTR